MESSLTNERVLAEHIPWEPYKTTGQISDRDFAVIKRFDKSSETAKASALDEDTGAVFDALFSVLRNISHEGTVQYTLALLDEIIRLDDSKAVELSKKQAGAPDRAQVLSRLLSREDWFTQAKAAKLLSAVFKAGPEETSTMNQFMCWLEDQLRQPAFGEESVLVAGGALSGLLRNPAVRKRFGTEVSVSPVSGVPLLTKCLKTSQEEHSPIRTQVLYNLGNCLWQLSFDDDCMKELQAGDIVKPLCMLLKEGNKEKVMRISLMTLLRMVQAGEEKTLAEAVEAGLPRIIRIRSNQTWSDEDIPELLKELDATLDSTVAVLSSFDKYKAEVFSGKLDWTPMHTNTQFWSENIEAIMGNENEIIIQLLKVLEATSALQHAAPSAGQVENKTHSKVLAVACHDLAMIADVHPNGRYIINHLGGKPRVMALMGSESPELQKYALLCVQRLMLSREKLDFLTGPGNAQP